MSPVNAVLLKIKSEDFRRGFGDGFAALNLLYAPADFSRSVKMDASVEKSWRIVGDAIREADRAYRGKSGKVAGNRS